MEVGKGVWRNHLGSFTERLTRVEMVRVEKGCLWKFSGKRLHG
jgi:hypothetical protein